MKVSECAGGDSVSMLMSLSGVATKLDLLANQEEDQEKANHLHQYVFQEHTNEIKIYRLLSFIILGYIFMIYLYF